MGEKSCFSGKLVKFTGKIFLMDWIACEVLCVRLLESLIKLYKTNAILLGHNEVTIYMLLML